MSIDQLHSIFINSTGICTDTRTLKPGQLFFALKGDNFNGNTFAKKALDQGASYAIIDEVDYQISSKTILVDNVLKYLQDLATHHRQYLKIPIIAITGSNGKTTTKELITNVLSEQFKVSATLGNLNNHIGVPLTLLKMNASTEFGVVEMGANHQDEIATLCAIAQPDYGYITNFGKAHLEGFGGIAGVIKGKSELYQYLEAHQKMAFVNIDDPIQLEKTTSIQRYTFGPDQADCSISFKGAHPFVTVAYQEKEIRSQLIGSYNATNAMAAIAIGSYFKLTPNQIASGIQNYIPKNNRSQLLTRSEHTIILDAYNANPTSMRAALYNLKDQNSAHRIAILGDMFEVGVASLKEHQDIAQLTVDLKLDSVYLIGDHFNGIHLNHPKVFIFKTFDEFVSMFQKLRIAKSTILIKASRGMAMERILEYL